MSTVVITPPDGLIVSVAETKPSLRVTHSDDDALIEKDIRSATALLDGPTGWLGRALLTQTLEWRGGEFDYRGVKLACPPVVSIVSVKYDDGIGVEQTLSTEGYRLIGQPATPRLGLAYGGSWPTAWCQEEVIRIRYTAGYGDPEDVPEPIRHAVQLIVGEFYENRQATSDSQRYELPFNVQALIGPYRIY